jgi:hypothetical protein
VAKKKGDSSVGAKSGREARFAVATPFDVAPTQLFVCRLRWLLRFRSYGAVGAHVKRGYHIVGINHPSARIGDEDDVEALRRALRLLASSLSRCSGQAFHLSPVPAPIEDEDDDENEDDIEAVRRASSLLRAGPCTFHLKERGSARESGSATDSTRPLPRNPKPPR